MSGVTIAPSIYKRWPPCGWCGLRLGCCEVHATPTCASCRDGGRKERIKASMLRWKSAAEGGHQL